MKLQRSIGFITGTSYCVTIIIGAGVLGLPGAAVKLAGPNSIYAWALDFFLAIPLLFVFSKLISVAQSAGGIADFIKVAFGAERLYRFSQGLLLITLVLGTAAIALVGAQYLGGALGWSRVSIAATGAFLVLIPTIINSLGVKLGGTVQNAAALSLILFLFFVIASCFRFWNWNEVISFNSQHIPGMWKAMGLVWFAFTGVEMISFLGEDFKSPRTFILAVISSFLIVGFIYLGLAIATKLVVRIDDPLLVGSPLIAILKNTLGEGAAKFGGAFGFLLILINLTGAILGASRLIFSVGRDGVLLPNPFGRLDRRGVPSVALWALSVSAVFMILIIEIFHWPLESVFLLVSQNWFILYVLAIVSFLKLEKKGPGFILGVISLVLACLFMSVFTWFLVIPALVGLAVYLFPPKQGAPYVG